MCDNQNTTCGHFNGKTSVETSNDKKDTSDSPFKNFINNTFVLPKKAQVTMCESDKAITVQFHEVAEKNTNTIMDNYYNSNGCTEIPILNGKKFYKCPGEEKIIGYLFNKFPNKQTSNIHKPGWDTSTVQTELYKNSTGNNHKRILLGEPFPKELSAQLEGQIGTQWNCIAYQGDNPGSICNYNFLKMKCGAYSDGSGKCEWDYH